MREDDMLAVLPAAFGFFARRDGDGLRDLVSSLRTPDACYVVAMICHHAAEDGIGGRCMGGGGSYAFGWLLQSLGGECELHHENLQPLVELMLVDQWSTALDWLLATQPLFGAIMVALLAPHGDRLALAIASRIVAHESQLGGVS